MPTNGDTVPLTDGTPVTASFQSTPLNTQASLNAVIYVSVSAVSGTSPSMSVAIEGSPDGTNWYPISTMAAITAAGNYRAALTNVPDNLLRANGTITGTNPSFTAQVTGTACAA